METNVCFLLSACVLLLVFFCCCFVSLFVCLFVYLFTCLFVCLFVRLLACLLACLLVCMFIYLFICFLLVCLFLACMFISCLYVYLFTCLYVSCLYVYLFTYLFIVPGIPAGVSLDTYADTVKLGWSPPVDPDIKNYTVTWYPNDDPSKRKSMVVSEDEQQAFITDKSLNPQTYYTVEVAANSDEGKGKPWVMEGVVIGEADGTIFSSRVNYFNTIVSGVNYVLYYCIWC